eukprot:GHVN01003866.1.p1 GENE.GHVN01003866.1~~GHVN01003866.1.p1  ORF type:complete len:374 (+),score=74.69 GHVN01003866.1:1037-2158(+)
MKMTTHKDSRRVWLPNGRAPRVGEVFKNLELAKTLRTIGNKGVCTFYEGHIGRQIAQCVQDAGGCLRESDLIAYRAEWVEPISVDYRDGFTFHEPPPNGQGLTALMALNILKTFDIKAMGHNSGDHTHLMMEAVKLAFADAHEFIGDPRKVGVPVDHLLSDEYAAKRREFVSMNNALTPRPGTPNQHSDTVYLSVADKEGNMVSWIQSLYMGFGSGLTAGQTGVQLQNRAANFSLVKGHPNEADGGKRPFHTIMPGFITKDGHPWASFGVMGGFMQPQGHVQVGSRLVDFNLSPQAALDAPRFNWQKGKEFGMEASYGTEIYKDMGDRGHVLIPVDKGASLHYGGGQVIVRDTETGVLIGGSEPRSDGAAIGF